MIIVEMWQTFLYEPVFNALIWIYNNWTDANLGWAVVLLTVILRLALLPFTVLNERTNVANEEIAKDVADLQRQLANDPVLMKEEIRKALKKRKLRPWSKALVLGVQALVLLLLYQVFLGGVTGEKLVHTLYDFIDYPGKINTIFYGFDLAAYYDWFWSGLVALGIMGEVYFDYKREKRPLTKRDLGYFIIFPLVVFIALYILPMVKALFILTSMVFSAIVHQFVKPFLSSKKTA